MSRTKSLSIALIVAGVISAIIGVYSLGAISSAAKANANQNQTSTAPPVSQGQGQNLTVALGEQVKSKAS